MSEADAEWLIAGVVALNAGVFLVLCIAGIVVSRLSRHRVDLTIRKIKGD